MHEAQRLMFLLCACVVFIASFSHTRAFTLNRSDLSEPALTEAVLQELLDAIRQDDSSANVAKRRFDGGYGNRYGVAQSLGSKLMALKTAADWNNPGRKKRQSQSD